MIGQIIPWNSPLLMTAWKLAPALSAGNCVVLKPAGQTPLPFTLFIEPIADLLPGGVLNMVHGFGCEAGEALAANPCIAEVVFTGSTKTGGHILQLAAKKLIPSAVKVGVEIPEYFL